MREIKKFIPGEILQRISREREIADIMKEKKVSIEEASLEIAIHYLVFPASSFRDRRLSLLVQAYEKLKERKAIVEPFNKLKKITFPKPKNPEAVELFKKFYTAAKQDIEKTGKISEKTLGMIK